MRLLTFHVLIWQILRENWARMRIGDDVVLEEKNEAEKEGRGKWNVYTLLEYPTCETQVLDYSIRNDEVTSILSRHYLRLKFHSVFQKFVIVNSEYGARWPTQLQMVLCDCEGTKFGAFVIVTVGSAV